MNLAQHFSAGKRREMSPVPEGRLKTPGICPANQSRCPPSPPGDSPLHQRRAALVRGGVRVVAHDASDKDDEDRDDPAEAAVQANVAQDREARDEPADAQPAGGRAHDPTLSLDSREAG